MRKELVYSMMAIGGAFPVTVRAAPTSVNAATPDNATWSNDGDHTDAVIVAQAGTTENKVSVAW